MRTFDPYTEQVSGIIIGDIEPTVRAAVFYDGRSQGARITATSDDDARAQAKAIKRRLIADASPSCYADDSKWELRIYD